MGTFGNDAWAQDASPLQEANPARVWEDLARQSRYNRGRLAKLVFVSVRTLDRHFQKEYSITSARWLRDLQLDIAYRQVVSGKSLKEVSYDVGFKQPSHFSRCFRNRFGISPGLLANRPRSSILDRSEGRACPTACID